MKRGDFFFIDKNKISSEEAFKATLANVGQQLKSQYKLTTEENLLRVTRVR
jgi:hypothetical protein